MLRLYLDFDVRHFDMICIQRLLLLRSNLFGQDAEVEASQSADGASQEGVDSVDPILPAVLHHAVVVRGDVDEHQDQVGPAKRAVEDDRNLTEEFGERRLPMLLAPIFVRKTN